MLTLLLTLIQGVLAVAPMVEEVARRRTAHTEETRRWSTEVDREAMRHAWDWLQYHATQRMQALYFFVVAIAILVGAYAFAIVEDVPGMAIAIAVVAIVMVAFFNRMDANTRGQVASAEKALATFQDRLADATAVPEVMLTRSAMRRQTDNMVVLAFQAVSSWGFIAALIYALVVAL